MSNSTKVIYTADNFKTSPVKVIGQFFLSIFINRELVLQLFERNFKGRYKQSILGWAWLILGPLVTMGTFLLLNMSGILNIGKIPVPYPIYGLLGVSLWFLFSSGVTSMSTSIISAGSMVSKINFPRETLVFSTMALVLTDFLIRLGIVLVVFFLYLKLPGVEFLFFPVLVTPLLLLTLGIGLISSVVQIVFRDLSSIMGVILNFLVFLIPVMYTPSQTGLLGVINKYNPLMYLIIPVRHFLLTGEIIMLNGYLISSVIAIMIFLLGWYVFFVTQNKVIERM